ncbi:hypothetical protein P9775_000897 [Pseudomonas aeruginosa]|uniref:hypothetical protein n=1 Tax=Pseudomonas aeruginosa TaxID=287 RepID=UPI000AC35AC6|nr:hypothetical protein [Pseudomonas aeruginosa]MDE5271290.1 hypothetical protein [Pseudomonas aeruginosa]MDE5283946.1 hypothetical protein [Pseudomonas aeruginosa]WGX67229.1 hypothetical protein P7I96_24990 [Pseudomonas aeruginosa]
MTDITTPEFLKCRQACHQRLRQALGLTALGLLMVAAMQLLPAKPILAAVQQIDPRLLITLLPAFLLLLGLLAWCVCFFHWMHLRSYAGVVDSLQKVLDTRELSAARQALDIIRKQAGQSPLNRSVLQVLQPQLEQHLDELTRQHLQRRLAVDVENARSQCRQYLQAIRSRTPLIQTETTVRETLQRLQLRYEQLSDQWDEAYEKFSWWNKIKYSDGPDFSEIDQAIRQLKKMHERLKADYADEFIRLDKHFTELENRAEARIKASEHEIEQFIAHGVTREQEKELPLRAGFMLSAMSVPFSLWGDLATAGNIYDALRRVNGNYVDMSDGEIWLETLFMPGESLAGLTSLAKGAYFEQLVAADSGGALFEHFNNPGTDIVIDGVAYQLKSTSSAAYVNSVDVDIPIIATSEVAEQTRAIDSGFSNIELEHSVDLALGGSVIDTKDTALDALLTGVGGLGMFATIQGINHAAELYENGGDGVESLFAGAGVAIEGTARALVGTAELGYKVLNSAPSRFVGRTLLAGLKRLDDKMMGAGSKSE